jgi:DNA polymerase alpha subunit B
LTHDHIFPQCALQIPISKAVLVPNPGVLFINEFVVAISAADALLHLNNQELSKGQPVDRIARMANHLVEQSSFYPLSPSFEGVNIDYNCLDALEFPFKPNLLIIPSALKNFAKAMPSDDLVFLNPGQFCKKQSLGTCAFVSVLPPRPTDAESVTCLDFTNRCRVDVVQF